MKRILMIIPNLGFGGAQRVFHDVSKVLAKEYIVIECVFNFDNGHAYPSGNEIHSLSVPAGKNVITKIYFFLLRIYRLRKLKANLKIDYAISHLEGADYVNILSSCGEKIVLCVHGSKIYDHAIRGVVGWLRKRVMIPFLYKKVNHIITVAEGIADELINNFKIPANRISVIYNGFDLDGIRRKADAEMVADYKYIFSKPVLITHGRLVAEKNHQMLLDLINTKLLKDEVNLVIIGEGELFDNLVRYGRSIGLNVFSYKEDSQIQIDHQVFFLGYLSNPFVLLKHSSIFLFSSYYEGLPLALVEAMICELPVIARDCPYGPREILTLENKISGEVTVDYGVLISTSITPQQELAHWLLYIEKILIDSQFSSRLKQKSMSRALYFGSDKFEKRWLQVLQKV